MSHPAQSRKILLLVLCLYLLSSCNTRTSKKAVAVNNTLVEIYADIMSALAGFQRSLEGDDADAIEQQLLSFTRLLAQKKAALEELDTPSCGEHLLSAANRLITFYESSSGLEMTEMARLHAADSITYGQYDTLKLLIETVNKKQKEVNEAFLEAQKKFGDQCGVKLVQQREQPQ